MSHPVDNEIVLNTEINLTKQFTFIHKKNLVLGSIQKHNPEQESDNG